MLLRHKQHALRMGKRLIHYYVCRIGVTQITVIVSNMKICGIYKITNPKGRIYIGQSVNIMDRLKHYRSENCKGQIRLFNSISKYGWDEHDFEIICQCNESELNNLEIYYIE